MLEPRHYNNLDVANRTGFFPGPEQVSIEGNRIQTRTQGYSKSDDLTPLAVCQRREAKLKWRNQEAYKQGHYSIELFSSNQSPAI